MALVRRKKIVYKKYKGKTKHYVVYELHQIYRDPKNKKRVVTKYLCYLGKSKYGPKANERIRRFIKERRDLQYDADRLVKKMAREMKQMKADDIDNALDSI